MIQSDAVEAVLQRQHALDLVRLDHRLEHRAHGRRGDALGDAAAGDEIRHGEDAAQVVRGMPPLRCQPGVVVIQPADDAADIPGRLLRIQLELGARHTRAVLDLHPRKPRPQMPRALRIPQREQAAAERIEQAVTGRVEGEVRVDAGIADIIRDRLDLIVVIGADVRFGCAHGDFPGSGGGIKKSRTTNEHEWTRIFPGDWLRSWELPLIGRRDLKFSLEPRMNTDGHR